MLGGAGEAARIFITIGLNSAAAASGLKTLAGQVDGFGQKVSAWGKAVSSAFQGPLDAFGRIGDAADGVRSVAGAIGGLAQAVFSGAARNEQYAMSFEVLMGSTAKANAHINELKRFAAETPFTLPGIVEASKQLEVMGGATLNTIENLRLVGDVAAGTGRNIDEVGIQFGRLYDGIKSGTPLGEVMMRLGEMGALSGESRRKILALAEGVQSGTMDMNTAWKSASKEFGRFAGITAKQAKSLGGLWSTFTDTIDDSLAKFGTKLLPVVKPVLEKAISLVTELGKAGEYLADNIGLVAPIIIAVLVPAVLALATAVWGLAAGVIAATWPFLAIGAAVAVVFLALQKLFPGVDIVSVAFEGLMSVLGTLLGPLKAVGDVLGWLNDQLGLVDVGGSVEEATGQIMRAAEVSDGAMERMERAGDRAGDAFDPVAAGAARTKQAVYDSLTAIVTALQAHRAKVKEISQGIADATWDPIILAGQIAQTKLDLQAAKKDAADRDVSKREQIVNAGRVAELEKTLFQQQALMTTYGSRSAQLADSAAKGSQAAYIAALKAKDPEVKAALLAQVEYHRTNWMRLQKEAGYAGTDVGLGYAGALGSSPVTNAATAAAVRVWSAADAQLEKSMRKDGVNAGRTWADGLSAQAYYARLAALEFLSGARGAMEFGSPAKEGPWRKVDVWGQRAGMTFADELAGMGRYLARSADQFLSAGAMAMTGGPAPAPAGAGSYSSPTVGGYGGEVHIHLEFQSAVPYTPAEQQSLGEKVGPAVYDYLRQRGAV